MSLPEADDMPIPSDLEDEEESPYLRRQKAVAVRRSRLSRRLRWVLGAALFGSAVFLPVGYGSYRLAVFALTSPQFALSSPEDVIVQGNQYISQEEVSDALRIPGTGIIRHGENIFRLSLEAKRSQAESIPWVRSAVVSRSYPHRIVVQVVERVPVAFVNVGGRVKLIDAEGVLLETPPKAAFDFPVLRGLEARDSVLGPKSRIDLYREFSGQLAAETFSSGWLISEVDLADPDDLKALLVQGRETIEVHFGRNDFLDRFHDFLGLLPEARKTNRRIASVDLRYRNQAIVNPQQTSDQ
jgi:cell division protein FtsQ